MEINIKNYEAYFVDYLEGNLDEKLVDDFLEFLQQNPDLKEELSMFEPVTFQPDTIVFSKKEKLYREIYDTEAEFNRAAVARLEGDLSEMEKTDFEIYLVKHPEKQKEAELFNKTKLVPDLSVIFRKKNKLYQKTTGKTVLLWSVRIAAVLILTVVFYILSDRAGNHISDQNKMAQVENQVPKNETVSEPEQIQQVPVTTTEKKDTVQNLKKEAIKTENKKEEPKTKPSKSLRENSKGRIESGDLVQKREPVEVPLTLTSLMASLEIPEQNISLATIPVQSLKTKIPVDDERLLADVVKEKTGIDNLSLDKIKKAGLSLVAGFTKDNFSYQTNDEGQITEINYDSRLLAFTIPTRTDSKDEK